MAEVPPLTAERVGALVTGDLASNIVKELPNQNIRLLCKSLRNARDVSQAKLAAGRCLGWDSSDRSKISFYEPIHRSYVRKAVQSGCRPASFLLRGKSYTVQQRTWTTIDLENDGPAAHAEHMLQLVQSIPGDLPPGSPPLPTTHLEIHSALLIAGPTMAHAIAAAFPYLTHITLLAADVRANVLISAHADAPAISECLLHLLSSDPPPLPAPPPPPPANPDAGDARDADDVPVAALNAAAAPPAALPAVPHTSPLLPHLTSITVDATGGFPPMLHTALLAATHIRELRCCSYDTSLEQPYDPDDLYMFEAVMLMRLPDQLAQIAELHHLTSLHISDQYLWQEAVALVGTLTAYLPGLQRLELPQCMGDLCVSNFAGLVHLRHLAVPWQILGTQGLTAAGPLQHLTSLEVRALGTRQQNSAQEAALMGVAAEEAGGVVQGGVGGGGGTAGAAGERAAPVLPRLQRLVLNEARLQSPVALAQLWEHTCLRQLTMWTGNGPYRGLDDQVLAPFGEHERAAAMKAQEAEDRAGGVGGVPTLAFLHWEVWHGRLTAVGEVALGRCAELLAGVQQRAGGGAYREIELSVQRGRRRHDDAKEEVAPRAVAPVVGRHAGWLSRLSGVWGLARLRLCGLELADGDLQAMAAGLQELKALRLDGCLFPTASLPVLAALPRLRTLTLDVGCWWSHSLRRSTPGPSGPGAAILCQSEMLSLIRGTEQKEGDLGAPHRGPVPTSDPQFLLHEAPWRLADLCAMADQLQRVELWVEGEVQRRDVADQKAAVEAVCRSVGQLRLQAVERGDRGPAEAGKPVAQWARPEDA